MTFGVVCGGTAGQGCNACKSGERDCPNARVTSSRNDLKCLKETSVISRMEKKPDASK